MAQIGEVRPRDAESEPADSDWWVYILRCGDGSLYTGIARDTERRLRQHNGDLAGGARYTRGRRPVELIWREALPDRARAQAREAEIKALSRREKLRLVRRGPGA
jgi:putative endonuclease